ncbi:hypothetical protein [Amphritea sp. HPY]|uniref:hypothetical protein n=1 Tax=Amphritea sp. HPY TaxID=3421652 RepID=UPI003D7EE135
MKKHSVFWLIWAVALIPLFAAMVSYSSGFAQPEGRTNQGTLQPEGLVLSSLQLIDEQGLPYIANGRWRLLLLQSSRCQQICRDWNEYLPNIHTALGKDRDRLQWHRVLNEKAGFSDTMILVDPLGNLVTGYRLDQQPQAILKDLKRLLRVSRVG